MLTHCSIYCQASSWQVKKSSIKNYYLTLHQHNGTWFGMQVGEVSVVMNINLLWWWMVKIRSCTWSHYL